MSNLWEDSLELERARALDESKNSGPDNSSDPHMPRLNI
jgi:hypothetical protein